VYRRHRSQFGKSTQRNCNEQARANEQKIQTQHIKCWSHVSRAEIKDPRNCPLFISDFVHKFVYIPVSERFSFAKIIHPPDRCGISRSWLNSVIITQAVLGTIKGHTTQCRWCLTFWGSMKLACWLQLLPLRGRLFLSVTNRFLYIFHLYLTR
jgi:hypothetical protein